MKLISTIMLVLLLLNFGVHAVRPQSPPLSNKDIAAMWNVGIGSEVILKKIGKAANRFDTSTEALIELKKAGVADEVIAAMMDREGVQPIDPANEKTPAYSESSSGPETLASSAWNGRTLSEIIRSSRSIALEKSSAHPSRQALEKELMKRKEFSALGLTILRYKELADLYVEIGYVPLSWITHRYVYRIYDRRSGIVISAGETTSWGSLAQNLARHIAIDLAKLKG